MRTTLSFFACLGLAACSATPDVASPPKLPGDLVRQRQHVCYRAGSPLVIDGRLDELAWHAAPETELFVDIEGPAKARPRLTTRAKMLWDGEFFYLAAILEEPHVWATLTERDSVIFLDNDFEVFIDPDGDTQRYMELELNAFGTEWDLLLVKAYRDGGPPVHAWDIPGLRTAVHVEGTINDPSDTDGGWTVEIAIPWAGIAEVAGREAPPSGGDVWWVDFSRVEWDVHVEGDRYVKSVDPATGKPHPEHNWVWSPQGVVDMHRPETWGLVMFSEAKVGTVEVEFVPPADLDARFALRRVYEAQAVHREASGRYATDAQSLGLAGVEVRGWSWPPRIAVTETMYEAVLERAGGGGELHLAQDGRVWMTDPVEHLAR